MKQAHYSASQLKQYMRCSAQWMYRYVKIGPRPPSSALAQGSSYHKALETNFSQKITSQVDLPLTDVKDAYASEFDKLMTDVEFNDKEKSVGVDNIKGQLKDEGVGLVAIAHTDLAPNIQPTHVEEKFTIEFDNVDYTIEGRIDCIEKDKIRDFKTTAKTPSKDENEKYLMSADEVLQTSLYAMAKNINEVAIDYAVKLKTPKIVSSYTTITEDDKSHTLWMTSLVDKAIKDGNFMPNRNNFLCSKSQCGYWRECMQDYGGRVKD